MSNSSDGSGDERIGYRSPPKKSRFKAGNTEYLKRKKPAENYASVVRDFLGEQVAYREGHKLKRAQRLVVYLKKIQTAALDGDLAAISQLLDLRMHPKIATLKRIIIEITETEARL
jgi:hypothetical protein